MTARALAVLLAPLALAAGVLAGWHVVGPFLVGSAA